MTPDQRHRGLHGEPLKQREAVYAKARQRNPEHWSGNTRNWDPVTEVWLNPPKENQAEKSQGLKAAWLMHATTSLTNTTQGEYFILDKKMDLRAGGNKGLFLKYKKLK